jgi:lipoprotein-anchoring transpeptidase ErfK/SrfK
MATSSSINRNRNSQGFFFAFLIGVLMVILTICAAFAITPTVASALVGSPSPAGRSLSWSVAVIAKPTYTPHPVPTSTPTAISASISAPTFSDTSPQPSQTVADNSTGSTLNTQDSLGGKYILVSISQQHLYAYDNGQLVYSFIASTGIGNSTRIGSFNVLDKIPNAYGANWNIWMPNWLGIYWSNGLENGIHALPILPNGDRLWSGYLGSPISFGCVVLDVDNALQLYNWANIGTQVKIQW